MTARLDDPCRYLKGVGPRKAEALEKLGIRTAEDLLLHAPRQYYDRSHVLPIAALRPDTEACVRVQVENLVARPAWGGRGGRVTGFVIDDSGRLRVVWYTAWVRDVLPNGTRVMLAGRVVQSRGHLEMRQPEFERVDDEAHEPLHAARIVPFYPLVRGVTQKWLRALVRRTLESHAEAVTEVLPPAVRGAHPARATALWDLHFPADAAAAAAARERFKFEELFMLELLLARRRARARAPGPALQTARSLHGRYVQSLPFTLTVAQTRVLDEILADLTSGRCMQRLLQGEVGSGKTVLAASALLCAVGNGFQGALMAPTEVLAQQHAERLLTPCTELGVRMDLLIGSRTDSDKQALRARVQSGDLDLVIGTHALIQEDVRWARLGLAVVDEQHRFGVLQRMRLQQGSAAGRPHVLVLSATPIPRSLALTLFGDLDVSQLDEKPPGRQSVRTRLVPPQRRADLLRFVRSQLATGRQAYMVYPLVEESDRIDLRAATEEYESLRTGPLAGVPMGLLHGRLPAAEKERLLAAFRRGALRLLVSTTVVEVGIDVGTADLMIIHHPERFGLSQLHQLRGRVGRGGGAAWCFLLTERSLAAEGRERLREFARTEDGFAIAELDLRRRGPGDFLGTRQHGLPTLRFADLTQDVAILDAARREAFAAVERDPALTAPEHRGIAEYLEGRYQWQEMLAEIG